VEIHTYDNNMKKAIQVLNEIRDEGVIKEYAVGGAMAAMFYTEPIATYDLDVFVLFKDLTDSVLISLSPIYNALRARGYQEQGEYVYVEGVYQYSFYQLQVICKRRHSKKQLPNNMMVFQHELCSLNI